MRNQILGFAMVLFSNSYAQKDSLDLKPNIGINIQAGTFTYYGSLNNRSIPFNSVNKLNYGVALSLKFKSISANLRYDNLNISQELNTKKEHKNFQAKGNFTGLDFNYWPILKKQFGLFIGAGVSYFSYNMKTDTLNSNGSPYFYWSDGTIRDKTESASNKPTSKTIKRDYYYETDLGNKAYFSYPVRIGVMLRAFKDVQFTLTSNFFITNKNNLDEQIIDKKESNYFLYNTVGITYYFNNYDKIDQKKYKDINFKEIWSNDEDNDGVMDYDDKCFGTPKGIKVDKFGCPVDEDKDDIPDYKDKEKNTSKNKLIDINGIGQEPGDPIKYPIPEEE